MITKKQTTVYELSQEEKTALYGYLIGEKTMTEFSEAIKVPAANGYSIVAKLVPQFVKEGKIKLTFSK